MCYSIFISCIMVMDHSEVTLLFFLSYRLPMILSVIQSFFIEFRTGLISMALSSLDLFLSYLTRFRAVSIQNSTWAFSNLSCGVPQDSVLGPLFFTRCKLHNLTRLCYLQNLIQDSPLCWWHSVIHLFHSFIFDFLTWNQWCIWGRG